MSGSQLLIQTGVEPKPADLSNTIEKAVFIEKGVDWLERGSVGLWLWSNDSSPDGVNKPFKYNEVETIGHLIDEHQSFGDWQQKIHVDDISELCLDVLVGISEQESGTSARQILNDCVDRFNQRIRPLYN